MKVLLVNPPNNYYDTFELAPPLGLLALGSALREEGVDVAVLDFNLRGTVDHGFVRDGFYERAISLISDHAPDVVGLTSMAVNSHVALELARRVKAADSAVHVVLGGTHFSAIAEEVLTLYPWVDFVVKGEGELPARALIRGLRAGRISPDNAPVGLALRQGGSVVASHARKPLEHLDQLPAPAYDLVNVEEYFRANPERVLDYEPGRGCMYKCSFCYSPVHYGSGGQSKSIDRILADMQQMQDMGARHLFFVQDNFVNNARFTREACIAIANAGFRLTWNCYTTLPQMTEETMRLLGAAGCTNAFTGIDAVNEECQKEYLKKFYKGWEPLERTLRYSVDAGVTPTCAFLVENPSAGVDRVNRTLVTALFARCNGAGLRLNTLTLYNGTPSESAHAQNLTYSELKPQLLLDCPELVQVNEYARVHPRLFPFHNTFLPPELWRRFAMGMHVAYTLFHTYPLTLYRWVTEDGGSLWGMMEQMVDMVGDLTTIAPGERRAVERVLFARWFERQPRMQRLTAETFELERAELDTRRASPVRRAVRAPGDGQVRDLDVRPHVVVRLGYEPAQLRRFDLANTPARAEPRDLAVQRTTGGLSYFDLTPDAAQALAALRTRGTDEVVDLSPTTLETLTRTGIVSHAAGTP
jgi:hypothetical protein